VSPWKCRLVEINDMAPPAHSGTERLPCPWNSRRHGACRPEIAQLVFEHEHERIARLQAQRRCLRAAPEQVAIAYGPVALTMISERQPQLEHTILAAQVSAPVLRCDRRPAAGVPLVRGRGEAPMEKAIAAAARAMPTLKPSRASGQHINGTLTGGDDRSLNRRRPSASSTAENGAQRADLVLGVAQNQRHSSGVSANRPKDLIIATSASRTPVGHASLERAPPRRSAHPCGPGGTYRRSRTHSDSRPRRPSPR